MKPPAKLKYECKKSFWFAQREQFTKGKTYKGIPYYDDMTGEQRVEMYGYGTDFVYGYGEKSEYFDVLSPMVNEEIEEEVLVDDQIEQLELEI